MQVLKWDHKSDIRSKHEVALPYNLNVFNCSATSRPAARLVQVARNPPATLSGSIILSGSGGLLATFAQP